MQRTWVGLTTLVPREFRDLAKEVVATENGGVSKWLRDLALADLRKRGYTLPDFPAEDGAEPMVKFVPEED